MKSLSLSISIAILLFVVVQAQGAILTLDECVDLALRNNRGLKAAEADVAAAREQVSISKADFLPPLKLFATYALIDRPMRLIIDQNSFGEGTPPRKTEISTQDRDYYVMGLSMQLPLFSGGRLLHTLRKSEASVDEALLNEEMERENLIFRVRKAYYDALNAQLACDVVEKIHEVKKERLRVLIELIREGYAQNEDLLRQESDFALSEIDVNACRHKVQLARTNLRQHIVVDDPELMVKGEPRVLSVNTPLPEVSRFAIANNKELRMMQTRIKGADEDIAISSSAYYPKASVQANYLRQTETNITRADQWIFSANLEWSVFEWGKTSAEVRQKLEDKHRLKFVREQQEQTVAFNAEKAWRDIKEKEFAISSREIRVRKYEEIAATTSQRYSEGYAKLVDVMEAEAQLSQEFNAYMMAVNDLNSAIASLELATSGVPVEWFTTMKMYYPVIKSGNSALKGSIQSFAVQKHGWAERELNHHGTDQVLADSTSEINNTDLESILEPLVQ